MMRLILATLGQVNIVMLRLKDSNWNSRNKVAMFCTEGTACIELPFKVAGKAQWKDVKHLCATYNTFIFEKEKLLLQIPYSTLVTATF